MAVNRDTKAGMLVLGLAHLGRILAVALQPKPDGAEHEMRGHSSNCPHCGRPHGPAGCPHCAKKKAAQGK